MGYPTEKDKRQDKEANYFARCLLMPEEFLRSEIEKLKNGKVRTTEDMIKKLAKIFKVPEYQMTIRLTELKIIF
jgi:Zn-dependent peptidase ImmA (M78 family)